MSTVLEVLALVRDKLLLASSAISAGDEDRAVTEINAATKALRELIDSGVFA